MNWFTRLFRRKSKPEPEPDVVFDTEHGRDILLKPAADIIGRQGGQKRNRVHIYRRPLGYPIRLCDWIAVDMESIQLIAHIEGISGPAEMKALVTGLDWAETWKNNRGEYVTICKHCRATIHGKRGLPYDGLPVPGRERG